MINSENELVEMGTCRRPHGIRGGFRFHLYNSEESCLRKGSVVSLFPLDQKSSLSSDGEEWEIEKISFGRHIIVFLKNVMDRNKVEEMIPFRIFFPRHKFPEVADDEIYLQDLIGFDVMDSENRTIIGTMTRLGSNGAQVILHIKGEKNFDLPFVKELVLDIDQEQRVMTVIVPEIF